LAVHQLALPMLRESAVEPPRDAAPPPESPVPADTVMDEFWSWLLPIVEVETKEVPLNARRVPAV